MNFQDNEDDMSKSLPTESKFILSPILNMYENQARINAIIERSEVDNDEDQPFEINEVFIT